MEFSVFVWFLGVYGVYMRRRSYLYIYRKISFKNLNVVKFYIIELK